MLKLNNNQNDKKWNEIRTCFAWVAWVFSKLTWNEKTANFIVSGGKWIEYPSASNEKSALIVIIYIRQWSKAMCPQSQSVKFSACDAIVGYYPTGCCERNANTNKCDDKYADTAASRQRSSFHVIPWMMREEKKHKQKTMKIFYNIFWINSNWRKLTEGIFALDCSEPAKREKRNRFHAIGIQAKTAKTILTMRRESIAKRLVRHGVLGVWFFFFFWFYAQCTRAYAVVRNR